MPDWDIIVLGLVLVLALAYSAIELGRNLFRFLAPDRADEKKIIAQHGADTPDLRRALARRFGPRSHLRDAATGLAGLAGMVWVLWAWLR